jgi:hypothetical protein
MGLIRLSCWKLELFVERDLDLYVERAASFHTTRWTIVMSAVQSQAPGGQAALAQLCRICWYPLYMFARVAGTPRKTPRT